MSSSGTKVDEYPIRKFIRDARAGSLLIQIGSNDHEFKFDPHNHGGQPDHEFGRYAIDRGWRAILVEPMPAPVAKLQQRYALNTRVSVVQAAMCGSCEDGSWTMHFVNVSASQHHGSDESDPRCLPSWVTELSSISSEHLKKHQGLLTHMPKECAACAARLQSEHPGSAANLTPACMRRALLDNMATLTSPCTCFERLLKQAPQLPAATSWYQQQGTAGRAADEVSIPTPTPTRRERMNVSHMRKRTHASPHPLVFTAGGAPLG